MLGLVGKVVVDRGLQVNQEKLREWLESIPEIAREKESANVLAFVFFVEVLKGKEKEKEGVNGNA